MKRFVSIAMLIVMAAIALMGCAPEAEPETPPTGGGSDLPGAGKKVILLVSGTLGDKSFFDSAQVGMERIRAELGCEVKTLEMGVDPAKWEPTLADVSGQDWDLIIAGTWQMVDNIAKVAPQFPDKKYVIFDTTLDYTKAPYENVYSITYKQNEGSYLAGALAALVTTSDMPKANPEKIIGFLGGQDQDVINDFLVGYIEVPRLSCPTLRSRFLHQQPPTPRRAKRCLSHSTTWELTSASTSPAEADSASSTRPKRRTDTLSELTPTRQCCSRILTPRRPI